MKASAHQVYVVGGSAVQFADRPYAEKQLYLYDDRDRSITVKTDAPIRIVGTYCGIVTFSVTLTIGTRRNIIISDNFQDGNEKLIAAGSEQQTYTLVYDTASDTWVQRLDMSLPKNLGTGIAKVIDNRFFILGGWHVKSGVWLMSDEVYELKFEEAPAVWKLIGKLPKGVIKSNIFELMFPLKRT